MDICKERPHWNVFRDGCPHGESPEQIAERADRLITYLTTLSGNVALFSHGQFGCALGARWIGLPVIEGQHFSLGPAALSILSYSPHHRNVRVIALWNAAPSPTDADNGLD
jgi:broad specificity phosphatase PhoE